MRELRRKPEFYRRSLSSAATFALLLVTASGGLAGQSLLEDWVETRSGYSESARSLLFDSAGNVLVAGRETLSCVRFTKYNGDGVQVGVGANGSSVRSCLGVDFGISNSDTVSLVTGGFVFDDLTSPEAVAGDVRDYILDKYTVSGGGSGFSFGGSGEDLVRAVAVDGPGATYLTGGNGDGAGGVNCATYRQKGGDPTLTAILDDGREPICARIELDSEGNSIVAGVAQNPHTVVVEKWIWDDVARSAWGGATYLDSDDLSIETVTTLAIDDADDIYVAGLRSASDGTAGGDWLLFKVDGSTGAVVWTTVVPNDDPTTDATVHAIVSKAGALFATGTWPDGSGETNYLTAKLDTADGSILCNATYSGPGGSNRALSIATGSSDDVYVSGASDWAPGMTGFATVQYSTQCEGEVLPEGWLGRYDESMCAGGGANAVAVDARGDVYVAGLLCSELTTVKYRQIEPRFAVQGACPGAVEISVDRASPAGLVAILSSATTGGGEVPGGTCSGVELELADPVLRVTRFADDDGRVSFAIDAPESACGTFLQAVDQSSCETTDLATLPE